ncbi:MAG: hypothetical protein Q9208_007998 [Pyrenodesmia sp. 3 TL-2023]
MFSSKFLPLAFIAASTLLDSTSSSNTGRTNLDYGGYGFNFDAHGTEFYPDRCQSPDVLNTTFVEVETMVRAGLKAVTFLDQPPFNYFFDNRIAPFVEHVLINLLRFLETPQDVIGMVDIDCSNPVACDRGSNATEASEAMQLVAIKHLNITENPLHTSWIVSLCPFAQAELAPSPPACTATPGVPSLGWAMAKALVQMTNIVEEIYDDVQGPVNCHNLMPDRTLEAISNAENYAYFLQWSLDLGYGLGDGKQCLDRWRGNPQDVLQEWMGKGLEKQ